MDNNAKPEVKEPVKTDKELRKEKWKKFVFGDPEAKKNKEPMDKQDKLCYAGAVIFLILALLPEILRNFDPNYDPYAYNESDEPVEVVETIKKMSCNRYYEDTGFMYLVEVTSTYKNGSIQVSELKYTITLDASSGLTYEDIAIPEYNDIVEIESKGIANQENINVYILKVDYRLDDSLRNNEFLGNHNKMLQLQRQTYQDENYQCVVTEGSL